MWSLSSLRRLNSSSLLGVNGGFKCLSYVPPRFATGSGEGDNEIERNSNPQDDLRRPMANMSLQDNFRGPTTYMNSQDNLKGPMANMNSQENFRGPTANWGSQDNFRGPTANWGSQDNFRGPTGNMGSQDHFRGPAANVGTSNILKEALFSLQSQGPRNFNTRWNSRPMDFVKGVLEKDQFPLYNIERDAHFVLIQLKRNNTHINVTDAKGDTKFWTASGNNNVGGGGKVTRYAAEATAEYVGRRVREMGLKSVVMRVKGFTHFKKKRQAIMSFKEGYSSSRSDQNPIVYIEDVTRKPHNGCRLPKKRRI